MNTCIIPARGGSRRVPRKNSRLFHGYPIISYSIVTAIDSQLFEHIVVSTDDDTIAEIARKHGVDVHKRAPAQAADECGTQEVAKQVLRDLYPDGNSSNDVSCVVYATAPMLLTSDLRVGYRALAGHSYAMAVGAEPLRDAGCMYWGYNLAFVTDQPLIGPYTAMVPLPEHRVCDINTLDDWAKAEKMYGRLQEGLVDA